MATIITISNQKGGVGKTTTAAALGSGLAILEKKRVLVIDLDPQTNLTTTFLETVPPLGAYDIISKNMEAKAVIYPTESVDIIGASDLLSNVNLEITQTGKEYKLSESLAPLADEYDYIIIDTAPALGLLTVNAFVASDYIVVPAMADVYSLSSIGQLYYTFQTVKKYCNSRLRIAGILLTKFNDRTIINRDMANIIQSSAEAIGTSVFPHSIREGCAVREAQAIRKDIFTYAPKSNPAKDYAVFIADLMKIIKGGEKGGQ